MVTFQLLENGFIIHNENQISIEINGVIMLFEVENPIEFFKNLLNAAD